VDIVEREKKKYTRLPAKLQWRETVEKCIGNEQMFVAEADDE
jgi:hypothetical protein